MMEAKEEVMTTRVTEGAEALRALRMPVVPITAGSTRSFFGSAILSLEKEPNRLNGLVAGIRTDVEVERTGSVQNSLDVRCLCDLVKGPRNSNVLNNNDLQLAILDFVRVGISDLLSLVL